MTRLRYNNSLGQLGASLGAPFSSPISFDAASPNTTHYNGGNFSTNAFNAPAGSMIVALVALRQITSMPGPSISDNTSGALTWLGPVQAGQFSGIPQWGSGIFTAMVPSAKTGVVVTLGGVNYTSAWVFLLDNAGGRGATNSSAPSATSLSVTPTNANSWIFAVGSQNATNGSLPTGYGSGQSSTINGTVAEDGSGNGSGWAWATGPVPIGTPVNMSYTGGTAGALSAVEVITGPATTPTLITFASAPAFATIGGGDYIPLLLDPPDASATPNANFEIVYMTNYTAGATTGTVSRAQEGTLPVAHANGAIWVCGPTTNDSPSEVSAVTPLTGLTTSTETQVSLTAPGSACALYSVTVDKPCRLRLYASTPQATADTSRAQGVDPTGNHGLLLEIVFTGAATATLSPEVVCVNQNAPRNASFGANVRCDSGTAVTVTLNGIAAVP